MELLGLLRQGNCKEEGDQDDYNCWDDQDDLDDYDDWDDLRDLDEWGEWYD